MVETTYAGLYAVIKDVFEELDVEYTVHKPVQGMAFPKVLAAAMAAYLQAQARGED